MFNSNNKKSLYGTLVVFHGWISLKHMSKCFSLGWFQTLFYISLRKCYPLVLSRALSILVHIYLGWVCRLAGPEDETDICGFAVACRLSHNYSCNPYVDCFVPNFELDLVPFSGKKEFTLEKSTYPYPSASVNDVDFPDPFVEEKDDFRTMA